MIKILLVEDDLSLSNSVFDFLDDFADVMQVFDGDEGLYEAESGVYDLILLDLMLPEKDGFTVLRELRDKGVTTPVLIMTAKESLDDKGHGFELGADDYLTKPFYLEELKMRIQALLKRSGKFDQNTLLKRVQRYGFFVKPPNVSATFFKKSLFLVHFRVFFGGKPLKTH